MHKNNKYAKVIKNGSKIEYKKTVFSFAKKVIHSNFSNLFWW